MLRNRVLMIRILPSLLVSIALLGTASQAIPQPQEKMDKLLVYGDGFMFGAKEPEGWLGDTERASSFQMNILIYPREHRPPEQVPDLDGVIRLRVNKKVDENTEQDLAADMAGYKKRFPKVQFTDIEVSHPAFKCYSKLFSVDGQFHDMSSMSTRENNIGICSRWHMPRERHPRVKLTSILSGW